MVTQTNHGAVLFRFFRPSASRVELVASFTGWRERAVEMSRDGAGWWTVVMELPPGDHEFMYLIDGCWHLADFAASGVRFDEYGQWLSLLHVPAPEPVAPVTRPAVPAVRVLPVSAAAA